MFKIYLKTTLRNLMRSKFYSAINVVGLAIGITACILIMLHVQSELSYDMFHDNADRIYRVNLNAILNDDEINQPITSPPLAKVMQDEIPEIEEATRIINLRQPVIRHNNQVFNETKWYFVDANFFRVFSASFIFGEPTGALSNPHTVVLTETIANKYFGKNNPVGKTLSWENDHDYIVTGVIKDYPENSHFKPDFLASVKGQDVDKRMQWINNMVYTYYLLKEEYTKQQVDTKLEGLVRKYVGPEVKQHMGVSFDDLLAQGVRYKWYSQPLHDIHFNKEVSGGPEPSGNKDHMIIFSVIAIFILVIACINYMNMATARSASRAKEVGIRKSLGSKRSGLIKQFLFESVFVTTVSLILALFFAKLLLPWFNNVIGRQLELNYFNDLNNLPLIILFGIAIGIISGSYPAFFLASFNPVRVLKGANKSEGTHAKLRSTLVVFQLFVSIALISGTFFIGKQLNFLQNKELGFNKENLLVIKRADYLGNKLLSFKNELLAQADITDITTTSSVLGRINTSRTYYHNIANDSRGMNILWTDCDFIQTYQVELKEGRFFEKRNESDSRSVVLNESAVKKLNIENPVGKKIYDGIKSEDAAYTIIGVMKDFHSESLHKEMSSLLLFLGEGDNLTIRISGANISQTLKKVQQAWNRFSNGQSLDYAFLDEDFGRLYTAEERTSKIVLIFSALAISLACLGLLALAAFVAEQKTKEIGVRKVNGARIVDILFSLNKNFSKSVAVAFVVACPVAYYILNKWLENFAYKTTLNWWVFALSGVAALVVTILTVSWISWRAATKNPVEALRYE